MQGAGRRQRQTGRILIIRRTEAWVCPALETPFLIEGIWIFLSYGVLQWGSVTYTIAGFYADFLGGD